jgi:hypothetical protein
MTSLKLVTKLLSGMDSDAVLVGVTCRDAASEIDVESVPTLRITWADTIAVSLMVVVSELDLLLVASLLTISVSGWVSGTAREKTPCLVTVSVTVRVSVPARINVEEIEIAESEIVVVSDAERPIEIPLTEESETVVVSEITRPKTPCLTRVSEVARGSFPARATTIRRVAASELEIASEALP